MIFFFLGFLVFEIKGGHPPTSVPNRRGDRVSKLGTAHGRVDVVIISDIGRTVELKIDIQYAANPLFFMFNIIKTPFQP